MMIIGGCEDFQVIHLLSLDLSTYENILTQIVLLVGVVEIAQVADLLTIRVKTNGSWGT